MVNLHMHTVQPLHVHLFVYNKLIHVNVHFGTRQFVCYTEVSFMWRLFYTVKIVIGTLGTVR